MTRSFLYVPAALMVSSSFSNRRRADDRAALLYLRNPFGQHRQLNNKPELIIMFVSIYHVQHEIICTNLPTCWRWDCFYRRDTFVPGRWLQQHPKNSSKCASIFGRASHFGLTRLAVIMLIQFFILVEPIPPK